jgi:hypothetical protein
MTPEPERPRRLAGLIGSDETSQARRLLGWWEAVEQTPTEPNEAVLRVGSTIVKLVVTRRSSLQCTGMP